MTRSRLHKHPSNGSAGLLIQDLALRADAFQIDGLHLEVEAGEYLVLLGPTGAGKTLLLECLAGLRPPLRGTVRWAGRDLAGLPPERRGFGVLFSDLALFPHLTVRDNIAYGLRFRPLRRAERLDRAHAVAERVGIPHLLGRRVAGLSTGEAQRVALARALALEPGLLLLDEPLSALDRATQHHLIALLQKIHAESRVTVVHVTHSHEVALRLGERIAVLADGVLRAPRPPAALYRDPQEVAVARLLGLRNLFPRDPGETVFRAGSLAVHSPRVRPETRAVWIPPDRVQIGDAAATHPPDSPAAWTGKARVVDVRLLGPVVEVTLQVNPEGGASEPGALLHAELPPDRGLGLAESLGRWIPVRIPASAPVPLRR